MKKALVVFLLAIFMATGAFAQTTADAQVHMDFALTAPIGAENFAFTEHSTWNFNYLTAGTWLRVRHTGENARGWLQFRANGDWRGVGSATAGAVDFEIGHNELPWVQWGSVWFLNNSMTAIGPANSRVHPYFLVRTMGFYVGLTEGGGSPHGLRTPGGTHGRTLNAAAFPGFFAGYSGSLDGLFNFGFAVAGMPTRVDLANPESDAVFPWMVNAHLNSFALGPVNLRVVTTLYSDPQFGFFAVAGGPAGALAQRRAGSNDSLLVLECMLDINANIDGFGLIGFAVGAVTNFDNAHDGVGMQAVLNAQISVGNIRIIPGIMYRGFFNNDTPDWLSFGLSFRYVF